MVGGRSVGDVRSGLGVRVGIGVRVGRGVHVVRGRRVGRGVDAPVRGCAGAKALSGAGAGAGTSGATPALDRPSSRIGW